MKLFRLVGLLAAMLVAPMVAHSQARPPAQKTGPLTIYGTGSVGDVSTMSVTPNYAAPANSLAAILAGKTPMQGLYVATPSNSLANGLFVSQTPAGNATGSVQLNKILINSGAINTGNLPNSFGFIEPFTVEQHYGGTGWSGGVNTVSVYSFRDQATPANNNNGNFVAGQFDSRAVTTDGGTDYKFINFGGPTNLVWQGSGAKGAHFGINAQAGMDEDASNMFNVTGAEFNTYSHYATALLSTTNGSTAATYSNLSGKIGYGQVVFADLTQVGADVTLATVTPGANGTGSVTLSAPALKTANQSIQLRPSVFNKTGIQISTRTDDVVNGWYVDAMVSLTGQGGPRWRDAILVGDQNGGPPLGTASNILRTQGNATIANGFDMSSFTVTGSLLKGRTANLTENSFTLSSLNAGIDVGGVGTAAGIGYLDFHSSGAAVDYDARIFGSGGSNAGAGTGALNLLAANTNITSGKTFIKRGTNPESGVQLGNAFAAVVYNATNATGENGLLVKTNWGASTAFVLEAGLDAVGGNYASYFTVAGDGTMIARKNVILPGLPTGGGTARGSVCIDTTGLVYIKTTAGACI